MSNTGVESNKADGLVVASQKKQGRANNQKLSLVLVGLSANTDYELMAAIDTDTNVVDIGPFTTDSRGRAILNYAYLGHGHGGGKHHVALPASLDPVSLIREVAVYNSNSTNAEAVLTADLSAPDKLQYLIKRNLGSGQAKATLQIHATNKRTQFRLFANGLTPHANYLLAFNGEVVQANAADAKGRLKIHSLKDTPPYILDVRSVELWDAASNVVYQADLP